MIVNIDILKTNNLVKKNLQWIIWVYEPVWKSNPETDQDPDG